jgi:hypothetical protein
MRELLRVVVVIVAWVISFVVGWFLLSTLFLVLVNAAGSLLQRAGILHGEWGFQHAFGLPALLALIATPILATYVAYRASYLVPPPASDTQRQQNDDAA